MTNRWTNMCRDGWRIIIFITNCPGVSLILWRRTGWRLIIRAWRMRKRALTFIVPFPNMISGNLSFTEKGGRIWFRGVSSLLWNAFGKRWQKAVLHLSPVCFSLPGICPYGFLSRGHYFIRLSGRETGR